MGDMADMIIESAYWPAGDGPEQPVQCKYCKRDGFYWEETDAGWRLFTETGKLHVCGKYRNRTPTETP